MGIAIGLHLWHVTMRDDSTRSWRDFCVATKNREARDAIDQAAKADESRTICESVKYAGTIDA